MLKFFMVLTHLCAFIAFFILMASMSSDSISQSTALAAMACAIVAIPYAVTRVLHLSLMRDDTEKIYKALLAIRDKTGENT